MRDKGNGDKEEARLLAARYSHLALATKYLLLRKEYTKALRIIQRLSRPEEPEQDFVLVGTVSSLKGANP